MAARIARLGWALRCASPTPRLTAGVPRFKPIVARLRAELDGLVAHLYGLSENEFVHILATFPLVPEPVKQAARNAYRDVERGLIR